MGWKSLYLWLSKINYHNREDIKWTRKREKPEKIIYHNCIMAGVRLVVDDYWNTTPIGEGSLRWESPTIMILSVCSWVGIWFLLCDNTLLVGVVKRTARPALNPPKKDAGRVSPQSEIGLKNQHVAGHKKALLPKLLPKTGDINRRHAICAM